MPTTRRGVNYAVKRLCRGNRAFWWNRWLPAWHEGRGRYYSIGLWFIGVYRGY